MDDEEFKEYFEKLANLYVEHLNFKSTTDKTKAQIIEILEEIYQCGLDSDEGEFNEGWKTGHDIGYDEGYDDGYNEKQKETNQGQEETL